MRYLVFLLTTALMPAVFAVGVCAQINPPMVDQQRDAEKESYFATFTDLKRFPSADSRRKAYEAAIEYLKRFGGDEDPDARRVRDYVTEYERPGRQLEILNSYKSKNYAKTFELGRAGLEHDQENFFILSVLTKAGIENTQSGNTNLNEPTLEYARKALALLESGKVTKPEPFNDLNEGRGFLNVAVGALIREKSPVEAAKAFRKAVQSDSVYRTDPLTYHRLGIAILRGEFAQLTKEYSEKYQKQPPSAAQQEMLARISKLGLQALDAYARAVALSDRPDPSSEPNTNVSGTKLPPEIRNKILEQLTSLYKGFHNNSDAGLKELISTVLSKPLP
ncbi:MAG TPA: hypothetical protein VNO50_06540 [Pyrinomonadaceae bacterium]|nr:hypothetical protein [Pyrinomonadaceae bacterium]